MWNYFVAGDARADAGVTQTDFCKVAAENDKQKLWDTAVLPAIPGPRGGEQVFVGGEFCGCDGYVGNTKCGAAEPPCGTGGSAGLSPFV